MIAYIVLCLDEFRHFEATSHIHPSNVSQLMQHGFLNLYQHIQLHLQAADAINFKITSSLLLRANDKFPTTSRRRSYHNSSTSCASWSRQMNLRHIKFYVHTQRESSQHQEFELNQPTSVQPMSINDIGRALCVIEGPSAKHIFKKLHAPEISSSRLFDHPSISGPSSQQCAQLGQARQPRHHLVKSTLSHLYLLPAHIHIIKWQEQAASISEKTLMGTSVSGASTDNQHHPLQRSDDHHQVQ